MLTFKITFLRSFQYLFPVLKCYVKGENSPSSPPQPHPRVSGAAEREGHSGLHTQEKITDHGWSACYSTAGFNLMLILLLHKPEVAFILNALVFKLCFEEPLYS